MLDATARKVGSFSRPFATDARAGQESKKQKKKAKENWHLQVLIERTEGTRQQNFSLPRELFRDFFLREHQVYCLSLTDAPEDADCLTTNNYSISLFFSAADNLATVRRDKEISIHLVDPRHLVRNVRIVHSGVLKDVRPVRKPYINNLCAKATLPCALDMQRLKPISRYIRTDFGCIAEIYCISFNMCVKQDLVTVLLKGGNDYRMAMRDLASLSGSDAEIPIFVHLIVLSACLGENVDVKIGGMMEKTILFFYRDVMTVVSRTEEASNHVELLSAVSVELYARVCHYAGDKADKSVLRIIATTALPCCTINMSISRFGEMLFRVSFSDGLCYSEAENRMVKSVTNTYMLLLKKIASGRGYYEK